MFRFLAIFAVLGALTAGVFASAATLQVNGAVIQAGSDGHLYCDSDGVIIDSYMVNDIPGPFYGVEGIRVRGVDPACEGSRMYLRVDDAAGNALAYSKPGSASYGVNNWVIAQNPEPAGGYVFLLVDGGRTNQVYVDPALIENISFWIEGNQAP